MLQALGLSVGKERGRLPVPMLLVASGGCAVTTARWCSPVVCLCSPVLSARLFPSLRDALDLHAKGFQSCTQSQRPSMHSQCPCPPARCGSCAPWHGPAPWASVCLPQPGPIWLQWWTRSRWTCYQHCCSPVPRGLLPMQAPLSPLLLPTELGATPRW